MLTVTIDETVLACLTTALLGWSSIITVAILVSAIIFIIVLRQRIKERKKGEQHAYRNY